MTICCRLLVDLTLTLKRAALDHFELDSMSNMAIDAKIYEQNMKETRNTCANLLIPSRECGILSMR